jgi:hypothetical protein
MSNFLCYLFSILKKYLSVVLSFCLCCFCFVVAAFICMFCIFMTYSTSYCCHKLKYSWNLRRRVYPKVSGMAAWSENCEWCSSLPLGAVVLLFCESVYYCVASQRAFIAVI